MRGPSADGKFYIRLTEEERLRWTLCAGPESVSTWARKILNAVTVVEYGHESPGMEKWFAEHLYRNPIWDVELLKPEKSPALENLQREELQNKKRNPLSRVPLCKNTRLPVFACTCAGCLRDAL